MTPGYCQKQRKFYGLIRVTNKGQIAIPIDLRRELKINQGDQLVVFKREDGKGINLIKAETIAKVLDKLSKN